MSVKKTFCTDGNSHLFLGRLLVLIIIIVIVISLRGLLGCSSLLLIRLLFLLLLNFTESLPLGNERVCFSNIIGDDDVVKNGTALDLPQIETDEREILIPVHAVVINKIGVGYLFRFPNSFVVRIGDLLHGPLTLEIGVVLHGRFPLSILLVIPILWFLGLCIDDPLLLNPVIGLLVFGIGHHGRVHPICWLLVLGILDLLRRKQFPIVLHRTAVDFGFIHQDGDGIVWLHNETVDMGGAVHILFVWEVRLLQHIPALVLEDQVSALRITALVGSEHDVVGSWITECGKVIYLATNLHVTSTTFDVFLILGLILDNQLLAFIAERFERR